MFVIKRNGASQSMMFDKITSRLNILMEEAQITDIDAVSITQLLVQRMISGISTEQIDELACQIIMGKIHEGQKYGKLASRLAISNYHKTTSSSFKEVIRILRNNKDPCGEIAPLVSEELETFSGVDHEEMKNFVATGASDNEVAEWFNDHSKIENELEKIKWNNQMRDMRLSEMPDQAQEFLESYIPENVPKHRSVYVWFDVFDLEEGRL